MPLLLLLPKHKSVLQIPSFEQLTRGIDILTDDIFRLVC